MNLVETVRQNKLLRFLYEKSTSVLEVVPFYIFEEHFQEDLVVKVDLEAMEICFLGPDDIRALAQVSEVPDEESALQRRLARGCLCLAVKSKGNVCAYSWCNLQNVGFRNIIIPLKENEAYLWDARTLRAYRGKNLAPYVRQQLYSHLKGMGRTRFYSVSLYLNTSAVKFKRKLGAKPVRFYLGLSLLNKYHWNILLKSYNS